MRKKTFFKDLKVLLGVTGGIACYKAAELARCLVKLGADVQVVMTSAASAFIAPITFQALTGRTVKRELLDENSESGMGHIALSKWSDLILIAPCTANTMAQFSTGACPDLLTTIWLGAKCPKVIAPAMNQAMWKNEITQRNYNELKRCGIFFCDPEYGEQACGDVGPGRMMSPDKILELLSKNFLINKSLDRQILITAGPTIEPIDPARFISNRSSGKTGYAFASVAAKLGAKVVMVSGPTSISPPLGVETFNVMTAEEMNKKVQSLLTQNRFDIFIGVAAVADLRPLKISKSKIKKSELISKSLKWCRNEDVIANVAKSNFRPSLVVGFSAETEEVEVNARKKLTEKGLDFICANSIKNGNVFGSDMTELMLLGKNQKVVFNHTSKESVAFAILNEIEQYLQGAKNW